ncbi:hypothetical protein ACHAXM_006034 [Skeletonema potamos]
MYRKSRPSPEVIEVEEDANSSSSSSNSSDDDNNNESEWEKDENLKRRKASYLEKKCRGNNHNKKNNRGRGENDNSYRDNYFGRSSSSSSMFGSKKKSRSVENDDTSCDMLFDNVGDSDFYSCVDFDDDDDDDSSIEDVTDVMLAKKQKEQQKLMEEAELLETDSEDEDDDKKKRKRTNRTTTSPGGGGGGGGGKRRKVKLSPIEIVIEDEDVPDCPGAPFEGEKEEGDNNKGNEGNANETNNVNLSIKQRIIKLLNTGLHNESNEHEAKNALKLARRLLERHNLDQAVLLKERGDGSLNAFSTTNDRGDDVGSTLHGGIVTVNVLNRRNTLPLSSMPRWLENLIAPVSANFRVDAFMSFSKAKGFMNGGQCSVSFFGIKTNAQLAAYAFKTASERIAYMTASYEPPRSNNSLNGRTKQASRTRTARLSYALGIVAGLHEDVKRGLREEEEKRQENLRRARNAAKTGEAYQEDVDCNDDHGDELQQQQQQQSIPVEEKLQQLENENEARLALVDCNKKIAEDILKAQKINLSSRRKRGSISFNRLSYETGVVHSKEIDLNQKAIQQS